MVVRCVVPGCKTIGYAGFHSFPSNQEFCTKWLSLTRNMHFDPKKMPRSFRKICNRHFRDTDYEPDSRRLKQNVLPSLHLPPRVSVYEEHKYSKITKTRLWQRNQQDNVPPTDFVQPFIVNIPEAAHTIEPDFVQPLIGDIPDVVHAMETSASIPPPLSEIPEAVHENEIEIIPVNGRNRKRLRQGTWSMTDKKRDILKALKYSQKRIKTLQKKWKDGKINDKKVREYLGKRLTKEQLQFIDIQMRNSGRKSGGERYSNEDKSMLLAIYKRGPKCYRYLLLIFRLPSKRTLSRHSAKLLFKTGIITKVLELIRAKVNDMAEQSKYCVIAWDEVSVKAHLDYNHQTDSIDGFVDLANERRPDFATHNLTFMIRGISEAYKQSVASFNTDNLDSIELAELIKLVSGAVMDTGLKVLASISDMVYTNLAAVNILSGPLKIGRKPGEILLYKVNGETIIHCCDPPHVLKVLRNNLQTKNLVHFLPNDWRKTDFAEIEINETMKLASWIDVTNFYEENTKLSINLIPKIVDEHIYTTKMKMKVSYATQVFSNTFGEAMFTFLKQRNQFEDLSDTADILLFFNDVFDSVNGSGPGNGLKCGVTETSIHHKFWDYALIMISKMRFVDINTGNANNRSSILHNVQSTIQGFKELTRVCLELIPLINMKHLNQDMLENLFGCLRSSCQVAKAPTVCNLQTSFMTNMITNTTSSHSVKANCEKDAGKYLIQDLNSLFKADSEDTQIETFEDVKILYDRVPEIEFDYIEEEAISISSSSICRKLLQTSKCLTCKNAIQSSPALMTALSYPSEAFVENFKTLFKRIHSVLPIFCFERSIRKNILSQIEDIPLEKIGCDLHNDELIIRLKNLTILFVIKTLCKRVNDILTGKTKLLSEAPNSIEVAAFTFRQKKKGIGKYLQTLD